MSMQLWPIEGSLYPHIDAAGMRGEKTINETFPIGEGHRADVFISSEDPFDLHKIVDPNKIKIGISIRDSDNKRWFSWDADKIHGMHSHLASGDQSVKEHLPMEGDHTLAEFVSGTFEELKDVIKWKYPDIPIEEGSDFTGFG